ncbi:sensor histidine kinase [Planctobacterium marinum]|uniref:Signal transduction histidine kinase internal region domain-containing protein n=1 Tax=Planctobacterium marinum TaxID=1631968 RepID=A0AA48HN26_9ALTE|nr:hypothetical protein MACH26_10380 [Planctobacterium marinum]
MISGPKFKRFVTYYWRLSRNYSTPYAIAQLLVFAVTTFNILSNILVLGLDESLGGLAGYVARGLTEGLLFLVFCHYVLRGYLKTQFIQYSVNLKRGLRLLALLAGISALHVLFIYHFDASSYFGDLETDSMTIVINEKEHVVDFNTPQIWVIALLNQLILYLLWSLLYIFWHATKSKRELQKQVQEARIQQLTNQLNPHFLFNTLNSIRAMIFEDKTKAAELVTQLSELFRTHLQAHLKPSTTVEEEWRIAKQYLDIEKVRLEERLQLNIDIEPDTLEQKLPTLLLLTLAENAIKHGIAPVVNEGLLSLKTQKTAPDRWQLVMSNSVAREQQMPGTKTGLKNTRQRLQLMFADKAQLQITKSADNFTVTLDLPYV